MPGVGEAPTSLIGLNTAASVVNDMQFAAIPVAAEPSELSSCSRGTLLQAAAKLCSPQCALSLEAKVDNMTSIVGLLVQLLLIEHKSPGDGSPLTWSTVASSTIITHSAPTDGFTQLTEAHDATGYCAGGGSARGAVKRFQCPVCPASSKRLTEKGFFKHVRAWRCKHRSSCKKTPTCPGIASHPMFAEDQRGQAFVETVVTETLSRLTPGANAAHGAGTGNDAKVQQYFQQIGLVNPRNDGNK